MEAVRLKEVDKDYRNHLQAFLNLAVKATKGDKKPRPVYRNFKKFFNYEAEQKKARGIKGKSRFEGIGKLLKKGR